MVGWLVFRTTFSGHLCADLIRMAALSMISGRSGKLGGSSGKIQLAINRRTASALPTTIKYLAIGTAESSRELSNPGQPMAAMLDHTRVARQIDEGAPHRRIAHSPGKTTPRLEEILPQRVAYDAITMLDACTPQCSHNDIRYQLAIAFQTLLRPFLAHRARNHAPATVRLSVIDIASSFTASLSWYPAASLGATRPWVG
jgi:hypothetical protein